MDAVTYFMEDNRPYLRHLAEDGSVTAYNGIGGAMTVEEVKMASNLFFYVTLRSKAWYVENIKVSPSKDANVLIY